ncbi:hypothetical protein TraAM80_06845 [Trypanosoma rangeli]|uniref:RUN domain-containing protein n=1 Tax=Trypanosoma rangeli TaxID=5698 RepID=A0A3R7M9B3_TRYRA|nr:uncharacterized protein TraAM80_06845 [Trypanosoma rangeli]RNF01759.1 hypothetical protein TraAM80_06845 [Trypanosoma rangeli]|eukprot:RNF01759.1 hypothetical protein TraAM80_06845 [Trypanosoma rangeli]
MQELHAIVRKVLRFHPRIVSNYSRPSDGDPHSLTTVDVRMAEVAELLVTELVRVLSRGLHEGEELWSVLQTLERVPNRLSHGDASGAFGATHHRLKFSGQLIYVIKSTFVECTAAVRTRALIRLTLNQGVLLAALELIARWNVAELSAFYSDPASSVLCSVDGELWDAFLRACAPIGGVTLKDIMAGASKGVSVVKFDMKLALPDYVGDDIGWSGTNDCNTGEVVVRAGEGRSNRDWGAGSETFPQECGAEVGPGAIVRVQQIPAHGGPVEQKRRARRRKKRTKKEESQNVWSECLADEGENDGSAKVHVPLPLVAESMDTADAKNADRLLDRAEVLLLERWEKLAAEISTHESLLFEREDAG